MTYGEALAAMTNDALKGGVPAREIILNLHLMSHELTNSLLANAAAAPPDPANSKPLIIPPPCFDSPPANQGN